MVSRPFSAFEKESLEIAGRLSRRPGSRSRYEADLRQWHASEMARSRSHDVFLYATQYGYSVGSTLIERVLRFSWVSTYAKRLLCCSLSRTSTPALWVLVLVVGKEAYALGTPKMNSWRFFEGSSTSPIVRRQRPAPGQVMLHQQELETACIFFALLVNDRRSYNHVQGNDMRDSNPTFSCCLARVAIPCQVQQPGTAPPSGSKQSFFPLLFLPLLIEEQRWNLEQQISEVWGTLWCKKN